MNVNERMLRFENGFEIEIKMSGDLFLGLGSVKYQGETLRSNELAWTVYAESEAGARFDRFRLVDVVVEDESATIVFAAEGDWLPRIQEADAMGDARVKTRRLRNPSAEFRWTFRPIVEIIEENTWNGLAMQITVSSPDAPIHWLLEDTTWEIGGDAEGCVLIQQDVSAIDLEQHVSVGSAFSTIESFVTQGEDGWGGSYPMDMLPRAAGSSICDYQVKGDLALCLFAEHPGLTRSRIEKFAGERVIHYTDRPFFPLTQTASAPERKLLVCRHPAPFKRHEWRNLWLDCFCHARKRIHAEYGFHLEVPLPAVHSHLWDGDLHAYGPGWVDPLMSALPAFEKLGYREVFTHGVWESVTSDPTKTADDGNICCPYSFRFAEVFGGAANMKKLFDCAHAVGIGIYQWFGMQFARYSPIWKEHPDWLLREANGDPWDAKYDVLWAGRMRSGYGQHLEESVKTVKDETGLDSIFWDSYQNLGVTCVDWLGPDKAPQADEIFRMQARLQEYGFKQRCEIVTIFGVSQVALFGFEDDSFRRRLWQDTLDQDTAFVLTDTSPCFFSSLYPFDADHVSPRLYFWLAAHRSVPILGARPWDFNASGDALDPALPGGALAEEYGGVNRLYNAVLPRMHRLRVTEGGKYTLWLDEANRPAVIWAFDDSRIAYSGAATDVATGDRCVAEGSFAAAAGNVYLLGEAG